ncbi:MAG TPA: hypothetical protein VIX80_06565 [Candidatus Kapabacteria bacterium]
MFALLLLLTCGCDRINTSATEPQQHPEDTLKDPPKDTTANLPKDSTLVTDKLAQYYSVATITFSNIIMKGFHKYTENHTIINQSRDTVLKSGSYPETVVSNNSTIITNSHSIPLLSTEYAMGQYGKTVFVFTNLTYNILPDSSLIISIAGRDVMKYIQAMTRTEGSSGFEYRSKDQSYVWSREDNYEYFKGTDSSYLEITIKK